MVRVAVPPRKKVRIKVRVPDGTKRIIVRCAGQKYKLDQPYRHAGYLSGRDMRLRTE